MIAETFAFFGNYGYYVLIFAVTVFALFAISRSYLRLRAGQEGIIEFLFWTGLWTIVIVVAFMPHLTQIPANLFGIARGIDVFVYFGIIFLIYSIYRIYAKIEILEQEITELARASALEKKKNAAKNAAGKKQKTRKTP